MCTLSIFRDLLFIATSSRTLHLLLLCWIRGTGLLILQGFAPTTGLSFLLLGQNKHTLNKNSPQIIRRKPETILWLGGALLPVTLSVVQIRLRNFSLCLPISFYAAAESHPVSASSCSWSRSSCTVTRFLIPPSWRWRTNSYHTGEGLELTDGMGRRIRIE